MQRKEDQENKKLDEKIDIHVDRAIRLGGTGIGTSIASLGFAAFCNTFGTLSPIVNALFYPFIGGLAATGLAAVPLAVAGGYGIKKLIRNS